MKIHLWIFQHQKQVYNQPSFENIHEKGDKYSIAKMRADIYGMENENSGLKKSSKKKKDKKKQGNKKPDIAQELYNEVRESNFTRTISNPDAVIKKRREQKVTLLKRKSSF